MLELITGILLAAGAVYFVLEPILRRVPSGGGRRDAGSVDEGDDPDDDFSPRAVALRALKEIEFDRATGKLSDADYDVLKTRYTSEALVALRAESRELGAGNSPIHAAPAPRSPLPAPSCPTHGPRPEADAQFCSDCGRRLATAPGYCARCGTALESDAHYCHSCGARVAA
jgi:Double zinc ribbon